MTELFPRFKIRHFVLLNSVILGMFSWVDFREDGKKRVENRRENEWEGCLVEKRRGREK